MQRAPKICEAFSARATCSSSVPSCALKPRALGQTEPMRELQLDAEPIGVLADRADGRFVRQDRRRAAKSSPRSA